MNIMIVLANIFIILFEIYLYIDFVSGILILKAASKIKKIIILVPWVTSIYITNKFDDFFINLLLIPCIYFAISYLIFTSDLVNRCIYTLIFFLIVRGVAICFYIVLNNILDSRQIYLIYSRKNMLLYILIIELITLINIKLLKSQMVKDINKIDRKTFLYFLPLPISTFFIYGGMLFLRLHSALLKEAKVTLMIGCVGVLFSNKLLFYVFGKLKETMNKEKSLELEQLKENLKEQYYEKLDQKNKMHSQIIHNMNYYFETIGMLAKNNEGDKILKILEGIDINLQDSNIYSYCSNVILNAIITEKSLQAKMLDIKFNIFVEPTLDIDFIKDVDLISIFGNLISNAIEATQKSEKKYIDMQLYMSNKNKFVMFKLKNTFAVPPKRNGFLFETIKCNKEAHGIGIENARKIMESYGGYLNIDIQDNTFDVTAMLLS